MDRTEHTAKNGTLYYIDIRQDEYSENPREWSNLGTMVCWHLCYTLGDEQPNVSAEEWLRNFCGELVNASDADLIPKEHIERIIEKYLIILPLHLYDHSGITISCKPFACLFDSGQIGWIYCTMQQARQEYPDEPDAAIVEKVNKQLAGEVKTYNMFVTGNVYSYTLLDEDEMVIDSLCGIYGADDALAQAIEVAEYASLNAVIGGVI